MLSVPTEKGEPMREKLIELLTEPIPITKSLLGNEFAPKMKMGLIFAENVADHLLANGVTVPTGEIDFDYNAEDV